MFALMTLVLLWPNLSLMSSYFFLTELEMFTLSCHIKRVEPLDFTVAQSSDIALGLRREFGFYRVGTIETMVIFEVCLDVFYNELTMSL